MQKEGSFNGGKGHFVRPFFWHFQFLQNMETINLPFVALTTTSPLTFPLFPNNVVNCFAFLGRLCTQVGTIAVQSLAECMTRLYPGRSKSGKSQFLTSFSPEPYFCKAIRVMRFRKDIVENNLKRRGENPENA